MADEKNGRFRLSIGTITIGILLLIQIVFFSFGYGMLTKQVEFNSDLIKGYQSDQSIIIEKLDDLTQRLVSLEVVIQNK